MIDLEAKTTGPFQFSPCGVVLAEEDFSEQQYISILEQVNSVEQSIHWIIGDLLNYGEKKWGKGYIELVKKTGFSSQTLMDDKWVASRIEFSRRRENLSFSHHKEVAVYEPHEQELLLDAAERLGLSRNQLREQKELLLHPPKTVEPGQTWRIGRHLLYVGSSASGEFVKTVQQSQASFVFADPPYNAGVADWDTDFVWDHDYLATVAPIVAVTPGISAIKDFMQVTTMPYKWSMSYWINNGMTRGAIGFGNWIYVALFTNGSLYRNAQDLVRIDDDLGEVSITGGDHDPLKHKGRKPLNMMKHIVGLFTKEDEVVIDPFLGTGTTLIACEELGRSCVGAELNIEYCGSIIRRWERLTKQEATLL